MISAQTFRDQKNQSPSDVIGAEHNLHTAQLAESVAAELRAEGYAVSVDGTWVKVQWGVA